MPMRMTWRPGREGPTLYAYPESARAQDDAPDRAAATAPPNSATGPDLSGDIEQSEAAARPPDASAQTRIGSESGARAHELEPTLMFCLQDRAKFRMEFLPASDR